MFCHDEECLFSLVFSLKHISYLTHSIHISLRQAKLWVVIPFGR
jgi:hypothetical protein